MAGFDPTVGITAAQDMRNAYLDAADWHGWIPGDKWADSWIDFATQYSLAQQAFENNKEMWNLMNEYNSPQAQMQRFKEAGLNPMLAYSQGTAGNASSPVQYSQPNVRMSPNSDRSSQINQAVQTIGLINNVLQNVFSMYGGYYDLQIKASQAAEANYDRTLLSHAYPLGDWTRPVGSSDAGSLAGNIDRLGNFQEKLNIYSPNFDPQLFAFYKKHGGLPDYYNTFLTSDLQRGSLKSSINLTNLKAAYQKYYNEHLLPKFDQYQQGKIDLQEIEKEIENYRKETMTMIPAELRGILEPIVEFLGPFFKFIFRRSSSSGTLTHTVK